MKTLTKSWLTRRKACERKLKRFVRRFPKGIDLTDNKKLGKIIDRIVTEVPCFLSPFDFSYMLTPKEQRPYSLLANNLPDDLEFKERQSRKWWKLVEIIRKIDGRK